ncbi:uncharacterized protein ACNLHF_027074 [Anomaloglossus baeobatrachus]|uniref:uncharacterized protein LOC142250027 n=1 Tax=Anomaloglossus baeobatrachus TaxID=238106 RepID=UPI003F508B60
MSSKKGAKKKRSHAVQPAENSAEHVVFGLMSELIARGIEKGTYRWCLRKNADPQRTVIVVFVPSDMPDGVICSVIARALNRGLVRIVDTTKSENNMYRSVLVEAEGIIGTNSCPTLICCEDSPLGYWIMVSPVEDDDIQPTGPTKGLPTKDAPLAMDDTAAEDALPSNGAPATEDALPSNGAPATEDALPSNGAPATEDALPSNGAPATEDALPSNGAPAAEDALPSNGAPAAEDALPSNGAPAAEDALPSNGAAEDALLSNSAPAAKDAPPSNGAPAAEDAPPSNGAPAAEDAPPSNGAPAAKDAPPSNGAPAAKDAPPSNGAPAAKDAPPSNGAPAAKDAPPSNGAPAAKDAPPSNGAPAAKDALPSNGAPAAEDAPPSNGAPTAEDAPPTKDVPPLKDAPAANDVPPTKDASPAKDDPIANNAPPAKDDPIATDSLPAKDAPTAKDTSPSKDAPAAMVSPPTKNTPTSKDALPSKGAPAAKNNPASKGGPSAKDNPPSKDAPAAKDNAPSKAAPAAKNNPASKGGPSAKDNPPSKGAPSVKDNPPSKGAPSVKDNPPSKGAPAAKDNHPSKGAPAAKDNPPSKGAPAAKDNPPSNGAPAANDNLPSKGAPAANDNPPSKGAPAANDNPPSKGTPAANDNAPSKGAPAANDSLSIKDAPATKHASPSKGAPATKCAPPSKGAPAAKNARSSKNAPTSNNARSSKGAPATKTAPPLKGAPTIMDSPPLKGTPAATDAPSVKGFHAAKNAPLAKGAPAVQTSPPANDAPAIKDVPAIKKSIPTNNEFHSKGFSVPRDNFLEEGPQIAHRGLPVRVIFSAEDALPSKTPSPVKDLFPAKGLPAAKYPSPIMGLPAAAEPSPTQELPVMVTRDGKSHPRWISGQSLQMSGQSRASFGRILIKPSPVLTFENTSRPGLPAVNLPEPAIKVRSDVHRGFSMERQIRREDIEKGLQFIQSTIPFHGTQDDYKCFLQKLVEDLFTEGNDLYREGKIKLSLGQYTEGLTVAEYAAAEELVLSQELLCRLFVNRSCCYFSVALFEKSLEDSEKALSLDKENMRALYRKAKALDQLGKHQEAYGCISHRILALVQDESVTELAQELVQKLGLKQRRAYKRPQQELEKFGLLANGVSASAGCKSSNVMGSVDDIYSDVPNSKVFPSSLGIRYENDSLEAAACAPSVAPVTNNVNDLDCDVIGDELDSFLELEMASKKIPQLIPVYPTGNTLLSSLGTTGLPAPSPLPPASFGMLDPRKPPVVPLKPPFTPSLDALDSFEPMRETLDSLDTFVNDAKCVEPVLVKTTQKQKPIVNSVNHLFAHKPDPGLNKIAAVSPLLPNPLAQTYDFKQGCKLCYVRIGLKALDFAYRDKWEHKCEKDILLARMKSSENKTWLKIRQRPMKINFSGPFMLCKDIQSRQDCKYGDNCTFAYYQEEIDVWNEECLVHVLNSSTIKYSKIRPNHSRFQMDLCRHEVRYGCHQEDSCNFAHSHVELCVWLLQRQSGVTQEEIVLESERMWKVVEPKSKPPAPKPLDMKMKFVCGQCLRNGREIEADRDGKYCTAKARHSWTKDKRVLLVMSKSKNKWVPIRALPSIRSFPQQYEICVHVQNGKKCQYIGTCTFAHYTEEKDIWTYMKESKILDLQLIFDLCNKNNAPAEKPGKMAAAAAAGVQKEAEKQIVMPTDYADLMAGFHCYLCGKNSNSERQWQKHIQSEKHKDRVFTLEGEDSSWKYRFPAGEFKLCERYEETQSCPQENNCPFAHGNEELTEWHERRKVLQYKVSKARKDMLLEPSDSDFGKYSFIMQDLPEGSEEKGIAGSQ